MGIFFGKEQRSTNPTFIEPPIPPYPGAAIFGGSGSARTNVSAAPDRALQVPTVWACVGLLSNSVSMLPLETYQRAPSGMPRRVDDPPVVTNPALGMTQSEWLHMLMASLLLRGNAYGMIARDIEGTEPVVSAINLLNPDKVRVVRDASGNTGYKLGGSEHVYTPNEVWHVRGLTLPGSNVGLSPIAYAALTLGLDIESRTFARDFFQDGAHPSSVLSTTQPVNQDQARTIKDRFVAAVRGREPAVLGAGLTYTPIQIAPNESQFLETQKANVAQVARYFWIPPEMVGGESGGSLTYANVEQRSLDFLTYAVAFWLKRIEDAMFQILPGPQYVRFNTAALLRTDAETQAKVDALRIASKVMVPSEIRPSLDLPPMTEDQKAEAQMVPLTVTPNGLVKAVPAGKTPADSTNPEDQTTPKLAAVRSAGTQDEGAADG